MKGYLRFAKMEGGGNDFVVIEDTRSALGNSFSAMAKKLCRRKYSVGADGLLVLKKSKKADIKMKYFNSDGSLASFCGNGARCISQYAYKNKIVRKDFTLESDAGILDVKIKKDSVKIAMINPKDIMRNISLDVDGKKWAMDAVNTGVPHAVIFVDTFKGLDVEGIGRKVRFHKFFQPAGVNVNFVMKKNRNSIHVRTYERGVEAETLACGTGSVASSLIAGLKGCCISPVRAMTRGNDILITYFKKNAETQSISNVYLEGPAKVAFEGEIKID